MSILHSDKVLVRKKKHIAFGMSCQRPKTFLQGVGVFNAAGDLEGAVSTPAVPGRSPNGARVKAPETFSDLQ